MDDSSNVNSLDFVDLMEYDEFDDYDDTLSTLVSQRPFCDNQQCGDSITELEGVPLSIELSHAIAGPSQQCRKTLPTPSLVVAEDEGFVKAPELFLRFGMNGSNSVDDFVDTPTNQPNDCVELQYENEFDEDDDNGADDFLRFTESTKSYHSVTENENEQLLLEGIEFFYASLSFGEILEINVCLNLFFFANISRGTACILIRTT